MAENRTKSKDCEGKTQGDQNEFSTWVKANNLDPEIVARLEEEELDDLELLKKFLEKEINTLGFTPEQESTFCKALQNMQGYKDSELDSWAAQHGIKPETMQKLKSEGIDTLQILKQTGTDDLTKFKIKAGQRVKVTEAIAKLKKEQQNDDKIQEKKDTEFVKHLRNKGVKEETIKVLIAKDYDSLDVLMKIEQNEVDDLKLSKPQERILLSIVGLQDTKADKTDFGQLTYGQAFEQFLRELLLEESTIQELKKFRIDSPEALIILDKYSLNKFDLPPHQNYILEAAIVQLQAIYGVPEEDICCAHRPALERERTVIDACGRLWSKTKNAGKTGIANLMEYMKCGGTNSKPKELEMRNGMRILKLPVQQGYQDAKAKVRKCIIGTQDFKEHQKTIMIVGATGAGKSTLIDGFCNYIFDTKWEENNRFKLIDEHLEELNNAKRGQTMSQTEWITIYTIHNGKSNRLQYTLNLIDTPGFGDTRGIDHDQKLVEQIRCLFKNRGKHGIDQIDAVCFVAKAPDARLTANQRYIFSSVLSVFGKDIKDNILVMITFADGAKAPVLEAIREAELPYRSTFPFNNSALFEANGIVSYKKPDNGRPSTADTQRKTATDFAKMFWDMGEKSFKIFFDFLGELKPKSLFLTTEVLEKRQNLKDTLKYLETKVRVCLSTMDQLQKEENLFKENEDRIKANKDFTYQETRHYSVKIDCQAGRHVTHCMNCHETCHDDCRYKDDDQKAQCIAMNGESCTRCALKCHWTDHKNTGYFLENKTEIVTKTWANKQKEFTHATGKVSELKDIIQLIRSKYNEYESEVKQYVARCHDILQRLRTIALKPDPLTEVEYIEELISAEKNNHEYGWQERVKQLEKIKKEAKTLEKVHKKEQLISKKN